MRGKWLGLALVVVMVFSSVAFAGVKNPGTIIEVTIGGPATMDPHWSYDTASGEVIYNLYDNLINYKGSSLKEFEPMIATKVPSKENGLIKDGGLTYIFPIRKGVKFHNGDILTPEDVAYSFRRALIFDRSGGPVWMLCEPLLGVDSIEELAVKVAGVKKYSDMFTTDKNGKKVLKPQYKKAMMKVVTDYVNKAVEVRGDTVIFHLAQPYAPFLSILAHSGSWGSIIDKKWAIAQGAWDGKADTWWKYHDPDRAKDPLYAKENGTGPFVLKKWIKSQAVILERFDDYWRGPAKIKRVVIKYVDEWTTRKLMLQKGDADIVYVPPANLKEVERMKGVRVIKGLPGLMNVVSMWPWTINAKGNPYIGSGKLDGNGIPPNFFSDVHVRRAFSYLFPYELFIKKALNGLAIRNPGPLVKGLLGYSDDPSLFYHFSLKKAKEEFKKAWGGKVWEKGFKFKIFYNSGNDTRKMACDMIATYAKMINPKFKIEPVGVQWSAYLELYRTEKMPIFTIGWLADYPDPHNFIPTYMGSTGAYSASFGKAYTEFAKKNVDPLIKQAIKETDPKKRAALYKKLVKIAHDYAISLYLYQNIVFHVERTWVKGWYYNAIRPGQDFYTLSK